ncbi:MAG: response regulator, partial [Leptospiraceae bacterium]|nr:response regulator [Leptospiraceae bacterium]
RVDQNFTVIIDDKQIYQFGRLDPSDERAYIGTPFHLVPLKREYAGQNIQIQIYSEYTSIGIQGPVRIGNRGDLILKFIRDRMFALLSGLLSITIGLFAFFHSLLRRTATAAYFGFFAIAAGLFFTLSSQLPLFLLYDPLDMMYIQLASIFCAPSGLLLFIARVFPPNLQMQRKTMVIASIVAPVYALACLALYYAGWLTPSDSVLPFYIYLIIAGVLVVYSAIEALQRKDITARIFAVGLGLLLPFTLNDAFLELGLLHSRPMIHLGMFVFLISLGMILVQKQIQLIREKEYAQHLTRLRTRFLAIMSHEIRTPINGILGLTELLDMTDLNTTQRDYVHKMKHSGSLLLTIINDILDFSQMEADRVRIHNEAFSIQTNIEQIIEIYQEATNRKTLQLSYHIDSNVPDVVEADEVRIRQVLINLMSNAVKFTDRGQIRVEVRRLTREQSQLPPLVPEKTKSDQAAHTPEQITESPIWLAFSVSDSGMGIDQKRIPHIFDSFYQVEHREQRFGGTGLGLAICKRLVELMGGRIYLSSTLHAGSTFTFELPVMPVRSSKPHDQARSHAPGQTFPVLVVEDHPVNLLITTSMLRYLGFQVDEAENGQEAVDRCQNREYGLIFMDIQLPVLDGLEATRKIRELSSSSPNQPIIVALTAHAVEGYEQMCMEYGMNDYLTKPVSTETLAETISKWSPHIINN